MILRVDALTPTAVTSVGGAAGTVKEHNKKRNGYYGLHYKLVLICNIYFHPEILDKH